MDRVILHQEQRADEFLTWAIVFLGFAMVIAPLWILLFVTNPKYRLAIMSGFIFLFLVFVSFVTTARPFESFAATAA